MGAHLDAWAGIIAGVRADGVFLYRLCPISRHVAGAGGVSAGFLAHFFSFFLCRADRAFRSTLRKHAMDLYPRGADSYRIFGAVLQLCCQHSVPDPGAQFEDQGRDDGFWSRLPALATIDEIGFKCLIWGFPFMTLGLIAGSILAEARYGSRYFADPKILLSGLMWVIYMVLLYTRWNAGWRGRRAAYLATFAFGAAVLAWAANNFSQTHRFIAP